MTGSEGSTSRRRRRWQACSGYSEWPFDSILHKRAHEAFNSFKQLQVVDFNSWTGTLIICPVGGGPSCFSNWSATLTGVTHQGIKLTPGSAAAVRAHLGPHLSSPPVAASHSRGASSTGAGRFPSPRSGGQRPGRLESRKS